MKKRNCFFLLIAIRFFASTISFAQGFHWPLEAQPAVTSTFCEYRPRHFHSGIDLKTWRRIGLNVYAVDDGYVWRVKTSPWGSGRAVYLKLDGGRYAVYFHLSDFAAPLDHLVEQEQERIGRYSIDLFLQPGDVRVTSGQVIGYSGESGTGGPHLHFEIRDAKNRPLNPFKSGFSVTDTISPIITALSITPLNVHASVEKGHEPLVIPVQRSGPGRYRVDRSVAVTGRVGIGIRLHDLANAALNKLAVYRTDLYVDDRLLFRSRYDAFSFSQTRKVDLDRDFSLMRLGQGRFQRLYRAEGNDLPFYPDVGPAAPDTPEKGSSSSAHDWTSEPGWHTLRIVAVDANGNVSQAEMDVLVDRSPRITDFEVQRQANQLTMKAVAEDSDDDVQCVHFEYSTDFGNSWVLTAVDSANSPLGHYTVGILDVLVGTLLCRTRAFDSFGLESSPQIRFLVEDSVGLKKTQPLFQCEPRFFDTFVEWTVTADRPVEYPPEVTVVQQGGYPTRLDLTRLDGRRFSAVCPFIPHLDGEAVLYIGDEDSWDATGNLMVAFDVYTVTVEKGGSVFSRDGRAKAIFGSEGVYSTFWARIEMDSVTLPSPLPMRSDPYCYSPADIPFDKGATISLSYNTLEGGPERVGVYRHVQEDTWSYVGSVIDSVDQTISASVSSFGCFALLEDTLSPDMWNLKPREGSKITGRDVELFVRIKDRGSGIGREEDLVMELDGRRVISEYDPEGGWLACRVKRPLTIGEHVLKVSVTDLAGNTTMRESRFRVVR